jgi:hypothetical protein
MARGEWPGQDGQQGRWPGDDAGSPPPPWGYGQQGDRQRPGQGQYGQRGFEQHGQQSRGDGRWQPPEWRYAQDRNLPGNRQRPYAPGQPLSYFEPPQPGQRGLGPPTAQSPYRPPMPPQHGRPWPARHKALTGLLAIVGLIIVVVAANSGGSRSSPGSGTTTGSTTTASATATGAPGHATQAAAAVRKTHPGSTGTTSAAPQAPTPSTPVPTTPVPTKQVPTKQVPTRPAPTTSAAAATPPAPATPAGCHPLTNAGSCYEPGEFCRDSDHGVSGVAGDGEAITCADNDGWRWEPS